MRVTVVDYGMGNHGSIVNMLRHLGHSALVTSGASDILEAEKLIFPGVGSFDLGMRSLHEKGLVAALNKKVIDEKTPVLGICLGLQLMAKQSAEGSQTGLSWLNASVVKFDTSKANDIRVPHVGWNTVTPANVNPLLVVDDPQRFYFVHAYHLDRLPPEQILCTTRHGYDFISGAHRDNVYGVQFHPEKSHRFGMQLLSHFIENV